MSNFTILTIDDEENIRNGLADNFELEGYNVKEVGFMINLSKTL